MDNFGVYHLDINDRQMQSLKTVTFNETGFKERQDLQEWIVSNPNCLGEDLLIIQKEFDGFDNTSERLDLLALDKEGNLVIIENKTDSSGKDIVWQSIKYASYCSRLNNEKIYQIYADYLKKYENQNCENYLANAQQRIQDFLRRDFEDDIILNLNETSQRIILVAGNFRPEVTSAVLWLINFGIKIRCVKCQIFSFQENFFFNTQQILPVPEIEKFMVNIVEKKQEDIQIKNSKQSVIYNFWSEFIMTRLQNAENIYQHRSPNKENWLGQGFGFSGVSIASVITQNSAKIRVEINANTKEQTLKIFDYLYYRKDEVEVNFKEPINWVRSPEGVLSFLIVVKEGVGYANKADWHKAIEFLITTSFTMQTTLKTILKNF